MTQCLQKNQTMPSMPDKFQMKWVFGLRDTAILTLSGRLTEGVDQKLLSYVDSLV